MLLTFNEDNTNVALYFYCVLKNLIIYCIILFKIRLLRWYNFKRFECCDPKNRRRKHSLDIKGNIKGHMWFVSMGAVIENLINLNISTSYFLLTHIVVLLSL